MKGKTKLMLTKTNTKFNRKKRESIEQFFFITNELKSFKSFFQDLIIDNLKLIK